MRKERAAKYAPLTAACDAGVMSKGIINMVVFRDFTQDDIEYLVNLLNNKNVTKYLTSRIAVPYTNQDAEWWVNVGSKTGIVKAIEIEKVFVGCISATPGEYENNRSAEIGYWLGENYWGKGIATESVQKMTKHVFTSTNIVRLFAPVFGQNKKSMNVLEKCGYIKEGVLKKAIFKNGEYIDEHLFAKINS